MNELLILNESESQGGSLTDHVEELLKGAVCMSELELLFSVCKNGEVRVT